MREENQQNSSWHHKDSDYQPREVYMNQRDIEKDDRLKREPHLSALEVKNQAEQEKPENLEFEDSFLLGYAPFEDE